MATDLANRIISRQGRMEKIRLEYEPLITKACDYINPRRYDYTGTSTKGAYRGKRMYDGTAQDAFFAWVDGILGWLVSQAIPWFQCSVSDRRLRNVDTIKEYCQAYAEQMYWEYRNSNYYQVLPEFLRDGASVGTGTIFVDEDDDLSRTVHGVPHPRQIWIAEDRWGRPEIVHNKFTMTARQAMRAFKGNLSDSIKSAAGDPDTAETEYTFIHAVYPSDDGIFEQKITKEPYVEVYLETGTTAQNTKIAVVEGKYPHVIISKPRAFNPYTVWRFRKNSDEIYGYSPGMDVMGPNLVLQQLGKDMLSYSHQAVDPAMQIPAEMRQDHSLLPHGRNFYSDPTRLIHPVRDNVRWEIGVDREQKYAELIRARYGYNFWNALALLSQMKKEVTATQIMELQSERAMLLASQVDNLVAEGLSPHFNKMAEIASKAGRLPQLPAELMDQAGTDSMQVKFSGPLMQAQELLFKTRGIRHGLNSLIPLAQIFGPEIFDRINRDELVESLLEASGFPQRLLNSDEEVAQMQQVRMQLQQEAQARQDAKDMVESVPKLSKPIDENSIMGQLVNA